jgi:hypothetical protein
LLRPENSRLLPIMGAFWNGLATLAGSKPATCGSIIASPAAIPAVSLRAKHKLQAVVYIVTVVPSVRFPAEFCPCSESSSAFAAGQVKHQVTPEDA